MQTSFTRPLLEDYGAFALSEDVSRLVMIIRKMSSTLCVVSCLSAGQDRVPETMTFVSAVATTRVEVELHYM